MSQASAPRPPRDPHVSHPLQSVLDAIGHDPNMIAERRRIEDYIAKSAVVMSTTDEERPDLEDRALETLRKEIRTEVSQTYLSAPLSDRDTEWLRHASELLRVLTANGDDAGSSLKDGYKQVINALVIGAYARMAPDALVDDLARQRLAAQTTKKKDGSEG